MYSVLIQNGNIVELDIPNFYDMSQRKGSGTKKKKRIVVLKTTTEDACGNPLPDLRMETYLDKSGEVERIKIYSYKHDMATEYF
jgi:hypothetical protein